MVESRTEAARAAARGPPHREERRMTQGTIHRDRGHEIAAWSRGLAAVALILACGSEADPYAGEFTDVSEDEPSLVTEPSAASDSTVDKAVFPRVTFEGIDVTCEAGEQDPIREADARARVIIDDAITNGRIAVDDFLAGPPFQPITDRFLLLFGNDSDVFTKVIDKLIKVRQQIAGASHSCHAENELVIFLGGRLLTCAERSDLAAATEFAGAPPIRWCPFGRELPLDERAIILLHELTHQRRTANFTGEDVFDDDRNGPHNNAQNYSRWLRDAATGF